jgi:hypothetical protein
LDGDRQERRERLLNTTIEDVKIAAQALFDKPSSSSIAILGNKAESLEALGPESFE